MKKPTRILNFLVFTSSIFSGATHAGGQIAKNVVPTGGQVVAGQAAITQGGSQMNVQQSTDKAIINWQQFNVGQDAVVRFQQPSNQSVTLNRVISNAPSQIMGALQANGSVFIVNANGVIFGANSKVDVGGLVASALNISNGDFMNGNYRFFSDGDNASVINRGELIGKYVALLAPEVQNDGVIIATQGTAALTAGDAVMLNIVGNQLIDIEVEKAMFDTLVENNHIIQAEEGFVVLSAQSASLLIGQTVNSGSIEANSMTTDGGVVRLFASSSIAHSGHINVDAGANGNGGDVILLADLANQQSQTAVSGSISARGGLSSGAGGFVETSASKVQVAGTATIDTSASNGETGQWLVDPTDFTIGVNGDISASTLETNLATSNVTIQSINGAAGTNGDVFVNDSLAWSANALTLNAQRFIYINAPMALTGTASLNFEFGQSGTVGSFFLLGNYFVQAPIDLASGTGFSTKFGSDGATINYTVITNEAELIDIGLDLTGAYVLGADITASTNPWAPIGNAGGDVLSASGFAGVLDGLGHTIDGVTRANTANSTGVGLFGVIDAMGVVQNLGLTNVNIDGLSAVGALAGASSGLVYNVYSTGVVSGSDIDGTTFDDPVADIGGLLGRNSGSISNTYSSATVVATTGDQSLGKGLDGGIGGLVGVNDGTIDNSYATGNVSGIYDVGGFVGYTMGSIGTSYSTGLVAGTTNFGGFAGDVGDIFFAFPGLLFGTYWDTTSSGQASSGTDGLNTSTGLSTANIQQQSNLSDFDFTNTWLMYDGVSNPLLRSILTPFIVTADNQSKTYDGNVQGAFTTSSSVATPGTIIGAVSYGGSVTTETDAGSYTITPSGLALNNTGKQDQHGYYIVYNDGTLTIDPAALTVRADAGQTKVYGNADGVFSYAITAGSLVGADAFNGSLSRAAGENVGDYAINVGSLSAGTNYDLAFVSDDFSITERPVTVTADSAQSKVYGNSDGVFSYTITVGNLVGADAFNGSLSRAAGQDVGDYAINVGSLSAGANYDLAFVSDDFSITERPVTVTADSGQSKQIDAADPEFTYSVTSGSLVFGDTLTGNLSRDLGEALGAYDILQGTLLASANYDLTYAGSQFEIVEPPASTGSNNTNQQADTGDLLTQQKKQNSNDTSSTGTGANGDGPQIDLSGVTPTGQQQSGSESATNKEVTKTPNDPERSYAFLLGAAVEEFARAAKKGWELNSKDQSNMTEEEKQQHEREVEEARLRFNRMNDFLKTLDEEVSKEAFKLGEILYYTKDTQKAHEEAQDNLKAAQGAADKALAESKSDPKSNTKAIAAKKAALDLAKAKSALLETETKLSELSTQAEIAARSLNSVKDQREITKLEENVQQGDSVIQQSEDLAKAIDQANEEAVSKRKKADEIKENQPDRAVVYARYSAKNAKEAAAKSQKAADEAQARAEKQMERAKATAKRASLTAQLRSMHALLTSVGSLQSLSQLKGPHVDLNASLLDRVSKALSDSASLSDMEQVLADVKANASKLGATQAEETGNIETSQWQNLMQRMGQYKAASNVLQAGLKGDVLSKIGSDAASSVVDEAKKAVQRAQEALDRAKQMAGEASRDSELVRQLEAEAKKAEQLAADNMAEAEKEAKLAEAAAAKAKREAEAAKLAAERARREQAAARLAAEKARKQLGEKEKERLNQNIEAAKVEAAKRAESAAKATNEANEASAIAEKAKKDADKFGAENAKWKKLAEDNTKLLPKAQEAAKQDKQAAERAVQKVAATKAAMDKLEPDVEPAKNAQRAALDELLAAKSARKALDVELKAGNSLELLSTIINLASEDQAEIDAADQRLAKAQTAYDNAKKVADAKVDAFNKLADTYNNQEKERFAAETKAAESDLLARQTKSDLEVAKANIASFDKNVEAIEQYAKDTAEYAESAKAEAARMNSHSNAGQQMVKNAEDALSKREEESKEVE